MTHGQPQKREAAGPGRPWCLLREGSPPLSTSPQLNHVHIRPRTQKQQKECSPGLAAWARALGPQIPFGSLTSGDQVALLPAGPPSSQRDKGEQPLGLPGMFTTASSWPRAPLSALCTLAASPAGQLAAAGLEEPDPAHLFPEVCDDLMRLGQNPFLPRLQRRQPSCERKAGEGPPPGDTAQAPSEPGASPQAA